MKWNITEIKIPNEESYGKFLITVKSEPENIVVANVRWNGEVFHAEVKDGFYIYELDSVLAWMDMPTAYF